MNTVISLSWLKIERLFLHSQSRISYSHSGGSWPFRLALFYHSTHSENTCAYRAEEPQWHFRDRRRKKGSWELHRDCRSPRPPVMSKKSPLPCRNKCTWTCPNNKSWPLSYSHRRFFSVGKQPKHITQSQEQSAGTTRAPGRDASMAGIRSTGISKASAPRADGGFKSHSNFSPACHPLQPFLHGDMQNQTAVNMNKNSSGLVGF